MGMSTHVIGFAPPDKKWKEMKAVWDSCKAAGVDIPENVQKFFGWSDPDDNGVEIKIPAKKWVVGEREGFEIEVESIPKNAKVIRFYNSW